MNVNATWNINGTTFPDNATVLQKLGRAVQQAALVGGKNEWQPWRLRLFDQYVELLARTASSAPDDSEDRHAIIQCGAAVFHLKLALKNLGSLGRVELFPDLASTGLVARIHSGSSRTAVDVSESVLFEAMTRSNDSAVAMPERPWDESVLQMFQGAASDGKSWLEFCQCESSRVRLVELADTDSNTAAQRSQVQPERRIAQWAKPLLTFIVRPGDGRNISVAPAPRADEMAALATIKTKTDDKHGWFATGQMLARIKLQAKAIGISSRLFDRPFQRRRVREELRTNLGIGHKGFIQTVIGLGLQSAQWPDGIPAQSWQTADFETDTNLSSYHD